MNMTNGQSRNSQFAPGKGDTQLLTVLSKANTKSEPAVNVKNDDVPILPPCDPGRRQEFWLDTCRGVAHAHDGCAQIQQLYRKHGCRFAEPTQQQVRGILDALDGAVPKWESEHPELFYQTLELSFPELLIRR